MYIQIYRGVGAGLYRFLVIVIYCWLTGPYDIQPPNLLQSPATHHQPSQGSDNHVSWIGDRIICDLVGAGSTNHNRPKQTISNINPPSPSPHDKSKCTFRFTVGWGRVYIDCWSSLYIVGSRAPRNQMYIQPPNLLQSPDRFHDYW
jgi:hypothetical protein